MGSQLAELSSLSTVISHRILSAHQLAGTWGHLIGCTSVGTSVEQSDCSVVLWRQYSSSLLSQTGRDPFHIFVQQNSGTISSSGPICDSSHSNPSSQKCDSGCTISNQQLQSYRMEDSSGNLTQSVLCLWDPPSGHVRHNGEQGDSSLCFTMPRRQSLGGRHPLHIMGWLRPSVRLPSSSHSSQNPPEDQGLPQHHGDSHCFPAPASTVAPADTTTQPASSHTTDQHSTVPIHSQHFPPSIPQRALPVRSRRVALIQDILKQYNFPDTVVDMAADPLRDSSSNVYNSQWKAFARWANDKGIQSKDLSNVTLAEYLVHLFMENKQVNTIKVHRASIASVLKMLNPPTALQEDTKHNIIRRMSILHPRTQEVLPRWHLSIVLNGLMKPPFAINGSDKNLSSELLSYKTAFLVALATGARGSELVPLSRTPHILDFKTLGSGVKQVSIRMVPKFIPETQRPELIPKLLEFPGIANLFPKILKDSYVPWWYQASTCLNPRNKRKKIHNKNFLCISPRKHSYSLPTLGSWDYPPHLRKFVWIGSKQDSS